MFPFDPTRHLSTFSGKPSPENPPPPEMNQLPFISLPIYTAATTTSSPPPSPPPTTTAVSAPKPQETPQPPLTIPAGYTCFRLLCHVSLVDPTMKNLGNELNDTSATIRVEHAPRCSEERVISVVGSSVVDRTMSMNEESDVVVNSDYLDVSCAQEALVRVYERVLSVSAESDGEGYFGNNGNVGGGVASCRLLTDTSLVGYLIGKGGKVIKKIRLDTGCKIKILGKVKGPSCALRNDELVEIEGDVIAVKKALIAVTNRLQYGLPLLDTARMFNGRPHNRHINFPPAGTLVQEHALATSSDHAIGKPFGTLNSETVQGQREIVFRILCSRDQVGGVIGNSGTIVKALEYESGAFISVHPPTPGSDERLITIRAFEDPESQNSPAQNAVSLVFNRSVEGAYEKGIYSSGTLILAKVLIPHCQMGCLLGKGGSVMADMRKVTGAVIKIVSANQVLTRASDTDQIVLISGEFVNVRDALYTVTQRLRNYLLFNRKASGPKLYSQPPFEMRSSMATNHHLNQHASLTQSMDNLTLFNNVDHPSSSAPGQTQSGNRNFMNRHDVNRGASSVKGGIELGRGSRSAIVTHTTVEIMVPENVIGLVYGENGSNLTRIRQISGAKVVVHEPDSGMTDHTVVISGTPSETQSAQSLLQAFILAD